MKKSKSQIYQREGRFVFDNTIRRDFDLDNLPDDSIEQIKYQFNKFSDPRPIFEGLSRDLKRGITQAREDGNDGLLSVLENFNQDLEITKAAYHRGGEWGFVAVKMFHLGRNMESINHYPVVAHTHKERKNRVKQTEQQTSTWDEVFNDLPEKALEVWKKNTHLKVGGISDALLPYYRNKYPPGELTSTAIRNRLKKLKTSTSLPNYCFSPGALKYS